MYRLIIPVVPHHRSWSLYTKVGQSLAKKEWPDRGPLQDRLPAIKNISEENRWGDVL